MTRYWDSCAESFESVMRFISVRNWSSVGVAMMLQMTLDRACSWRVLCEACGCWIREVACGSEMSVVCAPCHKAARKYGSTIGVIEPGVLLCRVSKDSQ